MAYFVRSVDVVSHLEQIGSTADHHKIDADVITQSLKTKGNELSVWLIENYEAVNDAILSYCLLRDQVEAHIFIIIDEEQMKRYGLRTKPSLLPDPPPVNDNQSEHHDVWGLIILDLFHVMEIYREVWREEELSQAHHIIHLSIEDVANRIVQGCESGKIRKQEMKPKLAKNLRKWLAEQSVR